MSELDDLTGKIVEFRDARDWKQFHSPKNLAASICIEAAELLECFQWSSDATMEMDVEERRGEIEEEIADVFIYALLLSHDLGLDTHAAIERKLGRNSQKYPVKTAHGSRAKAAPLTEPPV